MHEQPMAASVVSNGLSEFIGTYKYPRPRKPRMPGRMQEIESAILAELARLDGRITTVRFLFYRLVAQAVIPKSLPGKRQPSQYVSDVARDLRESGVVPLDAIVDDGRGIDWNVAFASVKAGLTAQIDAIRLDPWTNEHACVPFLVVESRSLARVLDAAAS